MGSYLMKISCELVDVADGVLQQDGIWAMGEYAQCEPGRVGVLFQDSRVLLPRPVYIQPTRRHELV